MCSETVYPICSATGVSVTAPALLHFLSLSLPIAKRNRPENLECTHRGRELGSSQKHTTLSRYATSLTSTWLHWTDSRRCWSIWCAACLGRRGRQPHTGRSAPAEWTGSEICNGVPGFPIWKILVGCIALAQVYGNNDRGLLGSPGLTMWQREQEIKAAGHCYFWCRTPGTLSCQMRKDTVTRRWGKGTHVPAWTHALHAHTRLQSDAFWNGPEHKALWKSGSVWMQWGRSVTGGQGTDIQEVMTTRFTHYLRAACGLERSKWGRIHVQLNCHLFLGITRPTKDKSPIIFKSNVTQWLLVLGVY